MTDVAIIAANFDAFCHGMGRELDRYQRAYRKGRSSPRGSRARVNWEKIARKFGMTEGGHTAGDHIAGLLVFGTLNKIEDCQAFTRDTVRGYLAHNGHQVAPDRDRVQSMADAPFRLELTPEGEQTVIPGCERNASPKATQLDLFG